MDTRTLMRAPLNCWEHDPDQGWERSWQRCVCVCVCTSHWKHALRTDLLKQLITGGKTALSTDLTRTAKCRVKATDSLDTLWHSHPNKAALIPVWRMYLNVTNWFIYLMQSQLNYINKYKWDWMWLPSNDMELKIKKQIESFNSIFTLMILLS